MIKHIICRLEEVLLRPRKEPDGGKGLDGALSRLREDLLEGCEAPRSSQGLEAEQAIALIITAKARI